MKVFLEITTDQTVEIELETMPHTHDEWYFDGMPYFVHNIKWNHSDLEIPGVGRKIVYKPTIVIHDSAYIVEKQLEKD